MFKIITPIAYTVVAKGRFRAIGQPQQIPRITGMHPEHATPYGIVEVDLYELEQRVAAMYHDEIKDEQDENP